VTVGRLCLPPLALSPARSADATVPSFVTVHFVPSF
jgi:hypothetical protein